MPRKRKRHSCGLIIDPEIGPEIVAAGGYDSELLDTVDIYTVNTDSWRQGNINQYEENQMISMHANALQPIPCRQQSMKPPLSLIMATASSLSEERRMPIIQDT